MPFLLKNYFNIERFLVKSLFFNGFDFFLAHFFFLKLLFLPFFCFLGSRKLLTSLLSLYLRIELMMLTEAVIS